MKKVCSKCNKLKKHYAKGMCKPCYSAKWQIQHGGYTTMYGRGRRKKADKWFEEFKLSLGCMICGYNKCPRALSFHHVLSEKDKTLLNSSTGRWLYEANDKLWEEFYRCMLLCENCHREIHYKEVRT